jgi:hypothetical protein
MKYDGIFFDSGGTLFSFKSTAAGPDPGVGEVSAQGPERGPQPCAGWVIRWKTAKWHSILRSWLHCHGR